MREELLEYVWVLELCTHCCPTPIVFCDINSVVNEAEFLIRCLVTKRITTFFSQLTNKSNDLRRGVRNLNGIGLDMSYLETLILNRMLQVNHEESTTLGDDVILVPVVLELGVKPSAGQTVDNIDHDLQRIRQTFSYVRVIFCPFEMLLGLLTK